MGRGWEGGKGGVLVSLARTVAPLAREGRLDAFLQLPSGTTTRRRNALKLLPVATTTARA